MTLDDFGEIEGLNTTLSTDDNICALMILSKRYETLGKLLKDRANELSGDRDYFKSMSDNTDDFTVVRKKTRTTNKVNQEILRLSYPNIYKELSDKGKLVAKPEDLKDYDLDGVMTITTTTYLQLD